MARDFAREIAIAARTGDSESLTALAIELLQENGRLQEATEREAERRARDAERKRNKRPRNSEETRGDPTTSADGHGQARTGADIHVSSSPLVPSPSFPEPHLTTPLNPLSSPPPPTRARENEPDRPHAELESQLAARLISDADRNALTALVARVPNAVTWIAEMRASLDGMPGHVHVSPEQLGQALRDYSGNGAMQHPGMKHFRIYLRKAAQPVSAHAPNDDFDTAISKRAAMNDLEAEAAEVFASIRNLVRVGRTENQTTYSYLPKAEVEKMGSRALRAYEASGGSERFMAAKGDEIGYLLRDFKKAYAHASVSPSLVGGAA